jgi:hypothetical protein
MTVDHVGAPLRGYVYEALGYISAVSGFVFLSGLVAGFVYPKHLQQGAARLWKRAITRAWIIYLYHAALLIIFAMAEHEPLRTTLLGLVLVSKPVVVDILPMFVIFVLFIPLILTGFRRNMDWLVLLTSFALWAAVQFDALRPLRRVLLERLDAPLGDMAVLAWQFLFVLGMWIGYRVVYKESIKIPRNRYLVGLSAVFLLAMFLIRHELVRADELALFVTRRSTRLTHLGWLRLLNLLALVYVLSLLVSVREKLFHCRWLELLGRHSLQVFSYHVLVMILLRAMWSRGYLWGNTWGLIIALVFAASLTVPALLHERFIARRKRVTKARVL